MPKKEVLPEGIKNLKVQLERENNFIDYFLVCGVHPSLCQEENLYDFFSKDKMEDIKLEPVIISKCPPFDKTTITIDEGIINYCFPNGFKIIRRDKSEKQDPEPKFFSVILDNQFFSYEYPQKYVTCCVFYESLGNYKRLKTKIENHGINSSNYLTESSILSDQSSLSRMSISSKRSPYNISLRYYIPKCICLISVYPNLTINQNILKSIYNYSINKNLTTPIEKIILNLLLEVPLPPRGLYKIQYSIINTSIPLTQSPMNSIPDYYFNMKVICYKFSFRQIADILKHILYETKVIFFSSKMETLSHIILTFLSLIYPFKYPFQVASHVPKQNYSIIESISPYVFGVNERYTPTFFQDNGINTDCISILCIDVDAEPEDKSKKVILIGDEGEEYPDLPKKPLEKLRKSVSEFTSKDANSVLSEVEFNRSFSGFFFEFFVSLFKNYQKFLNLAYYYNTENIQNTNIGTLFKVKEFIDSLTRDDKPFYTKFVNDSQMFVEFIYKRMIPKNTKEKIDILFFDEKIAESEAFFKKDDQNSLLSTKEYKVTNSYVVPKQTDLTQNEIETITNEMDPIELMKRGEIITFAKSQKRVEFTYLIFPELLMNIFFTEKTIRDYIIPPAFDEEVDAISTDIVSKSSLNSSKIHSIEMENYIYLTWLELWAFSFGYADKSERNFRFAQMLSVLDKVIHHEMEIFNFLFEALSAQNEESMILTLYKILISYKLNPSIFIHTIISKVIDRTEIKALALDKNKKKVDLREFATEKQKFRKRTFRISCEKEILGEKVAFNRYEACVECQERINLLEISKDFSEIKKDVLWAHCKSCNKYILPKFIVSLGTDINTEGASLEGRTITVDEVVLHSPHDLKVNMKEGLYREYGIDLNLDTFKMKFTPLFWNAIWYFYVHRLPYEFILPYKSSIFDKNYKVKNHTNVTTSFRNNFRIKAKKVRKPRKSYVLDNKFHNLEISEEISETLSSKVNRFVLPSSISLNYSDGSKMDESYVNPSFILENSLNDTITKFSDYDTEFDDTRSRNFNISRIEHMRELGQNVEYSFDSMKDSLNLTNEDIGSPFGQKGLVQRAFGQKKSVQINRSNVLMRKGRIKFIENVINELNKGEEKAEAAKKATNTKDEEQSKIDPKKENDLNDTTKEKPKKLEEQPNKEEKGQSNKANRRSLSSIKSKVKQFLESSLVTNIISKGKRGLSSLNRKSGNFKSEK